MITPFLQALSAGLFIVAIYFLWQDDSDWAFGFFIAAVCSFFLGMRFQLKRRLAEHERGADSEES